MKIKRYRVQFPVRTEKWKKPQLEFGTRDRWKKSMRKPTAPKPLGQDRGGDPNGRLEEIFGVGPEGLPQWVFGTSATCPDNGLEKNPQRAWW